MQPSRHARILHNHAATIATTREHLYDNAMSVVSSKAPNPEKGARYLGQLDQALCNGNWSDIQELARKTDKHAPERRCFTLAARSEAQIASAVHRPTSASSAATSSIHGLDELVPSLTEAIDAEKKYAEDSYAAKVCLAEIHWLQENSEAALRALAQADIASKGGSHVAALGWLEVCDVKASFMRALALEGAGRENDARQLYLAAAGRGPGSRTPELRIWTERLLARGCMFTKRRAESPTARTLSEALRCFLGWSDFLQRAPSPATRSGDGPPRFDVSRRQVWKVYYDLLSTILQYGLMYNLSPSSTSDLLVYPSDDMSDELYMSAKTQQRTGLKQAEATYESLLLNETQFPKASQSNTEVEKLVQQVVSNWKVLCGSGWSDSELGIGGKESIGRGVLDILYRAATKTFHSTAILRQLFTVHAALGEFDLAVHAFNSYVEIVSKGKARAEKTGKNELGLDSDDTALLTAAEAVCVLCRYGDLEQGEKAIDVGKTIESWLGQQRPTSSDKLKTAKSNADDNLAEEARPSSQPTESLLQSKTLAAAYRAIGISQSHWARLTYETESRSALQMGALNNFRRAQMHDEDSIETAYALALLFAETRDVSAAIQIAKRAISSSNANDEDENSIMDSNDYSRERQLVPLWHLLALCLTAKDDYDQAAKMCQAAFDQFGESSILFGDSSNPVNNDSEKPLPRSSRGLVDDMASFEKESLLQLKMSQLTLIELMEGAEAAVQVGHELLGLYAKLFGNPEQDKALMKPPMTATSATPSKGGGTIRSFVGSMRPKSSRTSAEKGSVRRSPVTSAPVDNRGTPNGQAIGAPIAITVTNEDGVQAGKEHNSHFPFKLRGHHGDWRDHENLKSANSMESMQQKRATVSSEKQPPPSANNTDSAHNTVDQDGVSPVQRAVDRSMSHDSPSCPEQPLKEMDNNAPHYAWSPPSGHKDQPPRQDIRLPAPHPASSSAPQPRLTSSHDRQHKVSLLIKVWLFIAGMYLRADLLDDAGSAIDETNKLVESFEVEIGMEHSSARRFFEKGWAGGKSVDELRGDVWAAVGVHTCSY